MFLNPVPPFHRGQVHTCTRGMFCGEKNAIPADCAEVLLVSRYAGVWSIVISVSTGEHVLRPEAPFPPNANHAPMYQSCQRQPNEAWGAMSNGNQRRSFLILLRPRFLFSESRNTIVVDGQNNKHVDERTKNGMEVLLCLALSIFTFS